MAKLVLSELQLRLYNNLRGYKQKLMLVLKQFIQQQQFIAKMPKLKLRLRLKLKPVPK